MEPERRGHRRATSSSYTTPVTALGNVFLVRLGSEQLCREGDSTPYAHGQSAAPTVSSHDPTYVRKSSWGRPVPRSRDLLHTGSGALTFGTVRNPVATSLQQGQGTCSSSLAAERLYMRRSSSRDATGHSNRTLHSHDMLRLRRQVVALTGTAFHQNRRRLQDSLDMWPASWREHELRSVTSRPCRTVRPMIQYGL